MDSNPYISFVVVARNDNYGGDFLHRINVFVKVLLTLCEKHALNSELIIVEWNPPEDRPRLKDAILWPDIQKRYCKIRIIEVPNQVHEKLPNPAKLPLFEYIGKNVGVRRAHGEYILSTNPDVIFSEELIKFLASKKLSTESFYRIDRYDVKSPVPVDISVEEQLEYCQNSIIKVCNRWGTFNKEESKTYKLYKELRRFLWYLKGGRFYGWVHTNASGDFLLMHRNHWNALYGYPELEVKGESHHIDSLLPCMAQLSGLKQKILKNPLRLYHQDHGRPESGKPWSQAVERAYKQLVEERKLVIFNDERWGLGDKTLPEVII